MGTQAQVRPAVVAIDGDRVAGRHLAHFERLDDLALVRLIGEALESLRARDVLAHERLVGRDDLAHPVLDLRKVALGDLPRELEVVVEAVLDPRADRVAGAGPQVADGLRHHVRSRMTQDVEPVRIVRQDRLRLPVGRGHEREVDELAVHAGRDRLGWQHGAQRFAFGQLGGGAIGEFDRGHGTVMISVARARLVVPGPRYSYEMASSTFSLAARRAGSIAKSTPKIAASRT